MDVCAHRLLDELEHTLVLGHLEYLLGTPLFSTSRIMVPVNLMCYGKAAAVPAGSRLTEALPPTPVEAHSHGAAQGFGCFSLTAGATGNYFWCFVLSQGL